MKIVFILFIALKSIDAHSQSITSINDSSIVFMMPYHVDSLLLRALDTGHYFFYLKGSFNHYELQAFKVRDDITLTDWLKNTRRVIFLNQTFYPLLFETDELFGYITGTHGTKLKKLKRKYLSPDSSIAIIDFTGKGHFLSSYLKIKK